jgi:hypothetical protein
MPEGAWNLWFIRLSGWPIFLLIVAMLLVVMITLSIGMTWISNRSIVQNIALAILGIALIGFGILGIAAVLSRWA